MIYLIIIYVSVRFPIRTLTNKKFKNISFRSEFASTALSELKLGHDHQLLILGIF